MLRTRVLIALVALPLPLLVAAPAQAAPTPEAEPNDNIFQATATANTEGLTGKVGANGDVDYFRLGLRPQRQVKILATAAGCDSEYGSSTLVEVSVLPADGGGDRLAYLAPTRNEPSRYMTTTTPGVFGGPTQYFLVKVVDAAAFVGCTYTFQVQSATGGTTDAIDPTPPATYPVVPLAEPDDLPSQAHGPLGGETSYAGTIDTSNDVDQVYFQVRAGTAVNLRLTVGSGEVDTDSDQLDDEPYATAGNYDVSTVAVASQDRTYRLAITGDTGSTYQLLLTPGTSLGTTPPPPPYFARSVTIKRKHGAYVGRVRSADGRCMSSTVVSLRKKGRGGVIASATTSASGTWRIKRHKKVKKVYVTVSRSSRDGYVCGSDRSRVLKRGR
jgi:hypothetical protein